MNKTRKQIQPFCIEIMFSKMQAVSLVVIHCLAIIAVVLTAISFEIKIAVIMGILISFGFNWRQIISLNDNLLQYTASGNWEIELDATKKSIRIQSGTVITPLVIFLCFEKQSGEKQSMLIFSDAVTKKAFRVLAVGLKIHSLN